MNIDVLGMHYRKLNQLITNYRKDGYSELVLDNVNGQRYIGNGLEGEIQITINGLPGNDLGAFMDGPHIMVNANIQDGAANTMNNGSIVVHGNAGDVLGYGMRGGMVWIEENVGYRAGIHMKEYQDTCPVLVVGGKAGDFLGEYMAGGLILVLNLKNDEYAVGNYCGSGMHGGMIVVRGKANKYKNKINASICKLENKDWIKIETLIKEYEKIFSFPVGDVRKEDFFKIIGENVRPYHGLYVGI